MKIEKQGFRFVQSVTTVLFEEINDIRINSGKLDTALSDFFQTPGVPTAVGPGVDPNIPRLHYPSKFGHSILNISNVSAQLITNIDNAWDKDFAKIANYCKERESSLEKVLLDAGAKIQWVGWSVKIQKPLGNPDHSDFSAGKWVRSHFFKDEALLGHTGNPYEISNKIAFVEKDRFYFNFHSSNYKTFTYQFAAKPGQRVRIVNPALRDMKYEEQGVEFFLDVNSKYAFDIGPKQEHQKNDFDGIIQLLKDFIETRLGSKQWN